MDHPTSIHHGGSAALVLDPIIDGFHLMRVLMDGGSILNLLYHDTAHKMGINPSRIKPTKTTFKGVIPGVVAHCTGSITLEVVFGSPDNFRSKELIFDIVPFRSGYHALLGRTAFARFNVLLHYAYLKLKMPGPRGVITVMETWNAPFVPRSTLQPWQQKYRAAFSSRTLIRQPSSRTLSSESGVPCNRTIRHAKSMINN